MVGTKIKGPVGRYTFCQRKSSEKQLAKMKVKALKLDYSSQDSLCSYLMTEKKKISLFMESDAEKVGRNSKGKIWQIFFRLKPRAVK